jgi:hypothetical protein
MNGMLTTPYEIRNIYAQEYSASGVRSVSVLDGLRRVSFVCVLWPIWHYHADKKVFRVLELLERSKDVVSVLSESEDGSGSDTVMMRIGCIQE